MPGGGASSRRARTRSKSALVFEFERDGERTRVKLRQDVDPSDGKSIEQVSPDARDYTDKIPAVVLPGSGDRGADCGDPIPYFCPQKGCGEVYEPGRTCRRSRCPRCWESWAFYRARTMVAKLESLSRVRGSQDLNTKQHHVTVSFRRSTRFNSSKPLTRAIAVVKRLLHEINMDTGYLVYHPYRIATANRGEVTTHDPGTGDMTWPDVLGKVESPDWTWDAVRDEFLTYQPHFHVIGVSNFVQGESLARNIEEQTGVVIERITKPDSSVSIYDLNDLAPTAAYLLSHAGLRRRDGDEAFQSVVRAFGDVANFTAYDDVRTQATQKLRQVAPDVLGVSFPTARCSAKPGHGDHSHADAGTTPAGDTETSSERSAEAPASETDTWTTSAGWVPEFVAETCNRKLKPMGAATPYLENDQWLAALDDANSSTLREKYAEWDTNWAAETDADSDTDTDE